MEALTSNKYFWYIMMAIIIMLTVYFAGKKIGVIKASQPQTAPLPNNGSGIPDGWSANNVANQLYDAMFGGGFWGAGTDEAKIFSTLLPLTPDQCTAAYNTYNVLYYPKGESNLIKDFQSELSGDDLTKALSFFPNI